MHQQTKSRKRRASMQNKQNSYSTARAWNIGAWNKRNLHPTPSQLTRCAAATSPWKRFLIATTVSWDTTSRAEKNCISSSRRLVLPEKPSLLVKNALSKYYFPMNCTRLISFSKNTRTLIVSICLFWKQHSERLCPKVREHLEALQHKNRCWLSLTLTAL